MTEQQLQAAIMTALGTRSDLCRLWRINAGTSRAWDEARAIKGAPKGHPDITGLLVDGRWFGIEVKRPGQKQSPAQVSFEVMVRRFKGVYLVARSVEEAVAGIESAVKESRS